MSSIGILLQADSADTLAMQQDPEGYTLSVCEFMLTASEAHGWAARHLTHLPFHYNNYKMIQKNACMKKTHISAKLTKCIHFQG